MPGDGRLRNVQQVNQVAYAQFTRGENVQEAQSGRICEPFEEDVELAYGAGGSSCNDQEFLIFV